MLDHHVVFLHGWGGDIKTFGNVPRLLANRDFNVSELHLGEYTTEDDDLGIDDYAIALERAINEKQIPKPFDLVVFSTGALVARSWLRHFYKPDNDSPVRRLVMVAPANNGSRLASWGKKLPWDWGNKVLYALQLGSRYTWDLNWDWLETDRARRLNGLSIYHIQGAKNDISVRGFLDDFANLFGISVPAFEEKGSDNTVRICAANLNMKGVRLGIDERMFDARVHEIRDIPIFIFRRHSHFGIEHGILGSIKTVNDSVFKQLREILIDEEPSSQPTDMDELPSTLNYLMLNIRVIDQLGAPHPEYIPHFYFGSDEDKREIEIVHRNEIDEINCFYIRYKNLENLSRFGFQIQQNRIGNAKYLPSARIDLHWPGRDVRFLEGKKTHFVEVTVEKQVDDRALRLMLPM